MPRVPMPPYCRAYTNTADAPTAAPSADAARLHLDCLVPTRAYNYLVLTRADTAALADADTAASVARLVPMLADAYAVDACRVSMPRLVPRLGARVSMPPPCARATRAMPTTIRPRPQPRETQAGISNHEPAK